MTDQHITPTGQHITFTEKELTALSDILRRVRDRVTETELSYFTDTPAFTTALNKIEGAQLASWA